MSDTMSSVQRIHAFPATPTRRPRATTRIFGFGFASLLVALAGCASSSPGTAADTKATATTARSGQPSVKSKIIETPPEVLATTTSAAPTATITRTPDDFSIAARANSARVAVYKNQTGNEVISTLDNPQPSGAPLVFTVDAQTQDRAQVLLPIRPNGSTGWINLADVRLERVDYKLVIGLSAHKLTVYNASKQVYSFSIGVGKATTPTPDGRYYIKELLKPPNPAGAYGPFAYGLSGFSDAVPNYNGGDGVLGIHGTNEPDKVGSDVSHGCIRLRNADIERLAAILPLGTPVIVQA